MKRKFWTKFPEEWLLLAVSKNLRFSKQQARWVLSGRMPQKASLTFPDKTHATQSLFWLDLDSCYYAKDTITWHDRKKKNVTCVSKDCKPPNYPQLRPIEKFWSMVEEKIKKRCRIVNDPRVSFLVTYCWEENRQGHRAKIDERIT